MFEGRRGSPCCPTECGLQLLGTRTQKGEIEGKVEERRMRWRGKMGRGGREGVNNEERRKRGRVGRGDKEGRLRTEGKDGERVEKE